MPTVEDVARAACAAIDTDAGIPRAVRWTAERYDELASRIRLKHLRRLGEFTLPAPIVAGQALVAAGDRIVYAVGDALVDWSQRDLVGWWFRGSVNHYEIVSQSPLGIELRSPWAESAVGTLSYKIIQRFVPLADDVRWPGTLVHMRRRRDLAWRTPMEIDFMAPGRISTGGGPLYAIDRGVDVASGRRLVECYPYPNEAEQIVYTYTARPPAMDNDTVLPHEVSVGLLKTGVLIDIFRYQMAKALAGGKVEESAVWRNEARAQRTEWEVALKDLMHLDAGADDAAMILRIHEGGSDHPGVYDAHTDVMARWRGW